VWTDTLFNVWFWVSVVGVLVGLLLTLIAVILIKDRIAAHEFADQYNKDMDITRMVAQSGHGLEETGLIDVSRVQWQQDMEVGEQYARRLAERIYTMPRHDQRDTGNYTGKHEGSGKQVRQQEKITRAKEETHTYGSATGHKGGKHAK
jgi:hypothetical protein